MSPTLILKHPINSVVSVTQIVSPSVALPKELVYKLFKRSITEYFAVSFHSCLTVSQAADMERIQNVSFKIIFGGTYTTHSDALVKARLQTPHDWREKQCLDIATKRLNTQYIIDYFHSTTTKKWILQTFDIIIVKLNWKFNFKLIWSWVEFFITLHSSDHPPTHQPR